ncbi:MAG: hypothetical protein RIS94_1026 [Pseudomonadota bacterium]|jgi:hypothetical protein
MLARNDSNAAAPQRRTALGEGLCAIIAAEIERQGLSTRRLFEMGAIRRRQGFRERLAAALLFPTEIEALVDYLEIDTMRAAIAVDVFGDPDCYFEVLCLNLANVCRALESAVRRQGDALDCAFEPMRPALCAAVADRICQALILHHARVEEARSASL